MSTLRVALFGSPAFALPVLDMLARECDLAVVVSQPDRRAGRGMRMTPPPTKKRAVELGIPVLQPERVRGDTEFLAALEALNLDVIITAAYGQILPTSVLNAARHGVLNVHASILPRWRGAAPIQWALMAGDDETGVTIMQTDAGMDTGPVRLVRTVPITDADTAVTLLTDLAVLGAEALQEALQLLVAGELPLTPQDDSRATHARMLTAEDGYIDWARSAREIFQQWQGVALWPGTSFEHGADRVKATEVRVAENEKPGKPGIVTGLSTHGVLVQCGSGVLELRTVQAPGRRAMPALDWARGRGITGGEQLG